MSYQGTEWARKIAGKHGEKSVLAAIGHRLDQRTNIAHVSESELARATGLSERQVRRNVRRLQERGVLIQTGGRGPLNFARYSFVGFECQKADILQLKNRTFATGKPDICDGKPDICDTRINRVRAPEEEEKSKEEEPKEKSKAFDPPTGASEGWGSNATSSSEAYDDDVEIERQALQRFGKALPHGKPRQFLSSEVARVIEAFNSSPVIARRAGNADRDVAMKLLQICSCEEIERGIVLGTARRMGSDNSAPEPVKVSSLAYFAPAIAEARSDPLMTEDYIARCRAAIEREASRRTKKEPRRATA